MLINMRYTFKGQKESALFFALDIHLQTSSCTICVKQEISETD